MLGDWHIVGRSSDLCAGQALSVRLLSSEFRVTRDASGTISCAPSARAKERYGLVWLQVEECDRDLPRFAEFEDERYQRVVCGPYGVHAAGPRIIENFLDMAHLPYVHAGILGAEPYTEVVDYTVSAGKDGAGPVATNCLFWQPKPTATASGASQVNYTYTVPRPFCAVLTKVLDGPGDRGLAIFLSVQPVEPEFSIAWILYAVTDRSKSPVEQRARQEMVFFQDKPILENQRPKLLPLDPAKEMSIRGDRLSAAYRRYLREQGVTFGVMP